MMRLKKNATVTGTSFTNINTDNSVIEVSTTGTYSIGTGEEVLIRPCQNQGNGPTIEFIPENVYEIILLPGETLTITGASGSGVQMTIGGLAWEERF